MITRRATQDLPDESTTGRHIKALDGVRGIAVSLVLLGHLYTRFHSAASAPVEFVYDCIKSGWIGVDLFFVLSGFLITGILYDTENDPHFYRNFYARRALRILPLYYLSFAVLIVFTSLAGAHWSLVGMLPFLFYLQNLISFGPVTDSPTGSILFMVLWSLVVEEQFYLFWPFFVHRLRTKRRIAVVAVAGALVSFLLRFFLFVKAPAFRDLYAWTPVRLDGLLLGGCLAMLVRSRWRARILKVAPVILAGGLLTVGAAIANLHGLPMRGNFYVTVYGYLLLALTGGALIASSMRIGSLTQRFCNWSFLRLLGRYSYFIYLVHFPLRLVVEEPLFVKFRQFSVTRPFASILAPSAVVLIVIVAGSLSFRFIEQPILSLKRYFKASTRPRVQQLQMAES
jgi:peptidoglycan/LPS O-acetylase OafA/YrhL